MVITVALQFKCILSSSRSITDVYRNQLHRGLVDKLLPFATNVATYLSSAASLASHSEKECENLDVAIPSESNVVKRRLK